MFLVESSALHLLNVLHANNNIIRGVAEHNHKEYIIQESVFQVITRALKTLDTTGNCQRPVFSLGVSQHMHKLTNLWKFELNWSKQLRDNNERKNHPCHTKLCAFWCLISNLRSRNQTHGKLLLSRKLRHFGGSCFSQCFIQSTSPHYS